MNKPSNRIICRCEEVTEDEIRENIKRFDLRTVDEVRRLTRAGMGLCQGRTCTALIRRILANEMEKNISGILPPNQRPPIRPVRIEVLRMGVNR
jgi:NAD(P)H-nitrite reductase large subunit